MKLIASRARSRKWSQDLNFARLIWEERRRLKLWGKRLLIGWPDDTKGWPEQLTLSNKNSAGLPPTDDRIGVANFNEEWGGLSGL
jgi:hypothetical protein